MNKTQNIQPKNESGENTPDSLKPERRGVHIFLGILAAAVFWGIFVYAVWTRDLQLVKIFAYIIALSAGVFGTIHFLSKLYQHISKS